ncbi:MAG: glutaminyl-peptide cyclotransferase [Phycisphaerales bacterium]|nr:MAG: glutaminyl-peptide cyclotransferase [Phycisphaerales bacterium]
MYGCDDVTAKTRRWARYRRLRRILTWGLALFATTWVVACPDTQPQEETPPPPSTADRASAPAEAPVALYGYKVIRTFPHDPRHFTQGLIYRDGFLYEGTGLYGQSVLIKRELATNKIVKKYRLPRRYFGEGISLFNDQLIQLTWKSRTGFRYDEKTFRLLGQFHYDTEGWGLTHDGTHLILSDGTDTLRFLDPNTCTETGRIRVRYNGRSLREINELEFIDGKIYANVLPTDYIAIIAPDTGRVTAWIDLRGLYDPPEAPSNSILNGIAYVPETKHLLVTGKLWPKLFEIELVPHRSNAP